MTQQYQKWDSKKWDQWMQDALNGDQVAYHHLLNDIQSWLFSYFKKRLSPSAVDDLIQETLMSIHAKRHTFDPQYPCGVWVAAIARHRWIDYMRKTLRHIHVEIDDNVIPFPCHKTQEKIEQDAADYDLQNLLNQIPVAQANIIKMVKLKEMSLADVSQETGHSVASIKIMVHRGMKKMISLAAKAEKEQRW
jgi:RNA polymerase sigma-70 factor (ECF subfamily)